MNRISPKTEKILVGGVFHEKVGCIEIGNNVFIGTGSIILYDTKIGSNVIVAAGSIITKDVPDNVVVAGIPAKVIGTFDTFLDKRIQETYLQYVDVSPTYYCMVDANAEWEKFYLKRGNLDD